MAIKLQKVNSEEVEVIFSKKETDIKGKEVEVWAPNTKKVYRQHRIKLEKKAVVARIAELGKTDIVKQRAELQEELKNLDDIQVEMDK